MEAHHQSKAQGNRHQMRGSRDRSQTQHSPEVLNTLSCAHSEGELANILVRLEIREMKSPGTTLRRVTHKLYQASLEST